MGACGMRDRYSRTLRRWGVIHTEGPITQDYLKGSRCIGIRTKEPGSFLLLLPTLLPALNLLLALSPLHLRVPPLIPLLHLIMSIGLIGYRRVKRVCRCGRGSLSLAFV